MPGFADIRKGFLAGILLCSSLLSACNGDTESSTATGSTGTTPVGSTSNSSRNGTAQTLSLSGSGTATVTEGQPYSFAPSLVGASAATFTVQNKPAWANFDVATGKLSGTPTAAHLGTYSNIVIVANSGSSQTSLAAFSITVAQVGTATGTATLTWMPPTQNTDGSGVLNLAGYRIYYGISADSLTNSINVSNPGLTAYTIADLRAGTHYFGITAYTTGGLESGISNIGSKTIM
ncbi:MAG: putative Ig domain-containing protein [Steroidobacteraceae bacterium]